MDQNSKVVETLNYYYSMGVRGYVMWGIDGGFLLFSFDLNGVVLIYVNGNTLGADDLLWSTFSFQNHPT